MSDVVQALLRRQSRRVAESALPVRRQCSEAPVHKIESWGLNAGIGWFTNSGDEAVHMARATHNAHYSIQDNAPVPNHF
jgi:hypothetical protein